MTPFNLGFLKAATDLGLEKVEAQALLKKAYESQMFKELPDRYPEEETEETPEDLETLAELIKQDMIAQHFSAAKHRINL